MKYIINNKGIVLFINNKPVKVEKSDLRFAKIIKCFDLPENEQENAVSDIITCNVKNLQKEADFEVKGEDVYLEGEKLPSVLAKKVRDLVNQDLPVALFKKFWKNLRENPSQTSVNELYDFLSYKELPLTEDGCFLAYKGLLDNFWSISGNKDTKVLKGQVDDQGRIYNGIGEEIEVLRRDVDDNRAHHCSNGLHVGSHDYATGFARGKMVIVKVNPKDVVSVPSDYNCQKCRVSAYTVVSEYVSEITASAVDSENKPMQSVSVNERNEFLDRIDNYLKRQIDKGETEISVRKIQNSFSPEYPSRQRVLDALDSLGYIWYEDDEDGGYMVSLDA
jgi:hypothetical protein